MPVTFNNVMTDPFATPKARGSYKPQASQYEIFGRLKMSHNEIAMTENVTPFQVAASLRKPEIRKAYDHGRSQTIMVLRQKQLSVALAGSERMLIYCGKHLADQRDDMAEPETPNSFEPDRHSWDADLRQKMEVMRQKVTAKVADGEA